MIVTFIFLCLAAFVGVGTWTLIHAKLNERFGALLIILIGSAVIGSTLFDIIFS